MIGLGALDAQCGWSGPGGEELGLSVLVGMSVSIFSGPVFEEVVGVVSRGQCPDGAAKTTAKRGGRCCAEPSCGLGEEDGVGHLIAEQSIGELLGTVDLSAEFGEVLPS